MSLDISDTDISIIYVGATWCAPCRTVKPQIANLAHKFALSLTQIDYDELEESEKDSVKKLPTVRILNKSGMILTEITTNHADSLDIWLRKNVRVNGEDDF